MSFLSPTIKPPAPQKQPFNIDANQTSTNQQAVPNVCFAGRRRIPFQWIAPAYNKRLQKVTATTGKDQESTVANIYYGDLAATLGCAGKFRPFDEFYRLIHNAVIVWSGTITRDSDFYEPITVDGYGSFYNYWGYPNQPRDTFVLTPISDTIPPGVDPRKTSTFPNGDETQNHP